jgi:transposase
MVMDDIKMPTDLASCQALIEQLAGTIESIKKEYDMLQEKYSELLLRKVQNNSERYIDNPDQLRLDLGDTDDAADAAEGLAQAAEEAGCFIKGHNRRKAKKRRNESFPDHLPRREVEAEVPDDVKHCPVHGPRTLIGHDEVPKLMFKRSELWVQVTKHPKFACADPECGVTSPDRPKGLVEGDRYDVSVAAQIINAKYGYHLPIYRQQDLFAGSGWTPSRSTLLNILCACAAVLRPLVEHMKQVVLARDLIATDDTKVTLIMPPAMPKLDPEDPRSQRIHEVFSKAMAEGRRSVTARVWAYRSLIEPLNLFDFTVSRHRDGPADLLANFQGTLLADCYAGYEGIVVRSDDKIRRAACVTHARRKVFDSRATYPLQASVLLAMFQQLYDIEDQAKSMTADERKELRQAEAVKIWDQMGAWRESDVAKNVLGTSNFGKALGYLKNQWDPLRTYLSDGRIPIDNNETEQLMKQVAIGRKNWLFVGSVEAGARAAGFMTLVSSALRNDLDVWAYVNDILQRLLDGDTDYASLRPDIWRQEHPEAVRQYRIDERRDRADRKQFRRAVRRVSCVPSAGP